MYWIILWSAFSIIEFLGDSVNNLTTGMVKIQKKTSRKALRKKLSPEEELFLTLVRFRRGYSVDTMAHLFGISSSSASVVNTWMQLLYCHFNSYRSIMFPEKQHFRNNLPRVFKTFKNIRCTIDCPEYFCADAKRVSPPRKFILFIQKSPHIQKSDWSSPKRSNSIFF
ncbi:unnamed protein product [Mytilus coruscus]|uniref:Transposase Helix-turn-helix domain-containing protein n=1 Tax=Mytilus coruscus TaxID=42192 RepID=A0A6J8BB17_MYTCO|nr:unnamed protein product [Mytilus coruscus]